VFIKSIIDSTEETKPNTTKANIHQEHKNATTKNKHKKLKPDSVTSYNLWPENGAGPVLQLPDAHGAVVP